MQAAAVTVANDSDFAAPIRLIEIDRPASGSDEDETAQSIGLMQQLAARDTISDPVQRAAAEAIVDLSPDATRSDIARAIFWWIKSNVRYTYESELQTPYTDVAGIIYDQTLIPPAALLSMQPPQGSCANFSMLTASLCHIYGIPAAFKTVAADKRAPRAYSHVYVIAQVEPGEFMALDTSNGPEPGAEYARPFKAKIWPNHQDTSEAKMIRNQQATAERISKVNRRETIRRRTSRPLLGDATDPGNFIDSVISADPGNTYNPQFDASNPETFVNAVIAQSSSLPSPTTGAGASASGLSKFFATVANDATSIVSPLIRQSQIKAPYYIAGANGAQILYDPSTGKTANAGIGSTLGTGVNTTYLLLGVAGVLAVVLGMSGRKH